MNEHVVVSPEATLPVQPVSDSKSAGAMLREAREAEGLNIAALAVLLKVPVKKLEALEADQFDLLPDIVFVRALAASVCRTLKIEPTHILQSLPQTALPHLKTDESGINTSFRSYGGSSSLSFRNQLTRPVVVAVLALLVGVVVIIAWPLGRKAENAFNQKSASLPVIASSATSIALTAANEKPMTTDVLPTPIVQSLTSASSVAPILNTPVPTASVAPSPDLTLNASPTTVTGSGLTTGLVVFTAHGTSWVEVIDAKGVVQVRKTLTSGEVLGISGNLPLAVVVGRANTVDVKVRGTSFDLAGIAKDNVARFEVK